MGGEDASIMTSIDVGDVANEYVTITRFDHELKSWVGLFEPIMNGDKTHDIRVMDRDFKVGDICLLREYEPTTKKYTGRQVSVRITYITSSKHQECAFSPFTLHSASAVLSVCLI